MKDPHRLLEDERVPLPVRRLIASAPPPDPLPAELRARTFGESQELASARARRRRMRRRMTVGALASAAVALMTWSLSRPPSEISAEGVAYDDAAEPRAKGFSPAGVAAPFLIPSPSGWLSSRSNVWGAQGAFYVDASPGSIVREPAPPEGRDGKGWLWRNSGEGRLCLKGESAGIQDGDFEERWGVIAGLELCHNDADQEDPDRIFSITECPWGRLDELRGVRFELEGPHIPSEMRLVFAELESKENAFVAVYDAKPGPVEVALDKARVTYQKPPRPARRDQVRGIEWLVPSRLSEPAPFDFCVKNIELF